MIHIHFSRNPMAGKPTIADIRKLAVTTEGWLKAVLVWDSIFYNFHDKTDEERQWVSEVRTILEHELIPEQYKTGTHLLHSQASFMGEDICIHQTHLLTTLHGKHTKCGNYQVVNWNGPLYCVACQSEIPKSEFKS